MIAKSATIIQANRPIFSSLTFQSISLKIYIHNLNNITVQKNIPKLNNAKMLIPKSTNSSSAEFYLKDCGSD